MVEVEAAELRWKAGVGEGGGWGETASLAWSRMRFVALATWTRMRTEAAALAKPRSAFRRRVRARLWTQMRVL